MPSKGSGGTGAQSEEQFDKTPAHQHAKPPAPLESFRWWWLLCLIPAAIHAGAHAHEMNPDGAVYLDMAAEALRQGPSSLINPLWSPGFPALLAAGLAIFNPGPAAEFPLAHLITFAAFCLALAGFSYFLKNWIASPVTDKPPAPDRAQIPLAFAVFLWISIEFIGQLKVAPDMLVAGIALFAAGICCRIYSGVAGNRLLAAFGAILGLGYYAKAPMLPMGILLLGLICIWPPQGFNRRRLLLPAAVFLLVASPLIGLLSARVGRFSLGEAGRLNYIWHVNGLKPVGWTGDDGPGHGVPVHPPRKLMDVPQVLEFGTPVKGTYPLWYDPAYWYAGAQPRFSARDQVNALIMNVQVYWWSAQMQTILIGGALALLALAGLSAAARWPRRLDAVLLCWAGAAMVLFALVHAEYRYVAAFIVPAWAALYRHLGSDVSVQAKRAVHVCVALVVLIQLASGLPKLAAQALSAARGTRTPAYIETAHDLLAAGIKRGDPIATVGPAFTDYYARYLGSRIVAHVFAGQQAPVPAPEDWSRARQALARLGVRALICRGAPPATTPGDWKRVGPAGPDGYSVLMIPPLDAHAR
ncbi:MAG: hypothetical protein IH602_18045 [Bryobacteraceae bacterium]|nr:hypothetical protein [Bryobacteraceae bacterium]